MKFFIANLLLSLVLFVSCDSQDPIVLEGEDDNKNEDEEIIDNLQFTKEDSIAREQLVGIWSIIYKGYEEYNGSDTTSLGTIEFLPNGIERLYLSYPTEYLDFTYKISSDYLYIDAIKEDSVVYWGGSWIYKYKFYDDRLRIDLMLGVSTLYCIYIYKRW